MSDKPDGGAAFPEALTVSPNDTLYRSSDCEGGGGMSLRDWFAGQALAGNLIEQTSPENAARNAYRYADAMISERDKT